MFAGDTLEINFATSALGYLQITLSDEDGNAMHSGRLFGDKIDRLVDFDGDISAMAGKNVTMEINLSDADIYSFRFFSK